MAAIVAGVAGIDGGAELDQIQRAGHYASANGRRAALASAGHDPLAGRERLQLRGLDGPGIAGDVAASALSQSRVALGVEQLHRARPIALAEATGSLSVGGGGGGQEHKRVGLGDHQLLVQTVG